MINATRSWSAVVYASVVVLLLCSGSAWAQEFTLSALVLEGDDVPGVGTVTRIDNVAISNDGTWIVEVDTDAATDSDSVLLRGGMLYLREGAPLSAPTGASIGSFDSVNVNAAGNSVWNLFLDGPASSEDSGIYFNDLLVIQESDVSSAPEFSPGTPYIGFFDVKPNDSGAAMSIASIDDPNISSSVDRAIVVLQLMPDGTLVSESARYKEGDLLSGQTEPVADFGTGPHQSAINDAGQVLFFADLTGSTSTDGAIYRDGLLLAQEGSPSPLAGRSYQFLSSRGMNLNNGGEYAFKANVDGSTDDDELIVLNGAVAVREGDSFGAFAPFALTSLGSGSGPLGLDDNGRLLWYGDWDDPNTDVDSGLFLNDALIVQEGVTRIDGLTIDSIANGSDAFQLSRNGQFIIFEATLDGGINGAFLLRFAGGEGPVADAGEDQQAVCEGQPGVTFNLDGSGSFDPNGGAISCSWSSDTCSIAFPGECETSALCTSGVNLARLTVTDSNGDSADDGVLLVVLDDTDPIGSIVSPADGACLQPAVVVIDDFVDDCDPELDRVYQPGPGPSYDEDGDYEVTLNASDGAGNTGTDSVSFIVDGTAPFAAILAPNELDVGRDLPVSMFVQTSDDDAASGGVVYERLFIDDCLVLDGLRDGDGDGLISDETLRLGNELLCQLFATCGVNEWTDPVFRVEADDCAGNTGVDEDVSEGTYTLDVSECDAL